MWWCRFFFLILTVLGRRQKICIYFYFNIWSKESLAVLRIYPLAQDNLLNVYNIFQLQVIIKKYLNCVSWAHSLEEYDAKRIMSYLGIHMCCKRSILNETENICNFWQTWNVFWKNHLTAFCLLFIVTESHYTDFRKKIS